MALAWAQDVWGLFHLSVDLENYDVRFIWFEVRELIGAFFGTLGEEVLFCEPSERTVDVQQHATTPCLCV